MLAYQFYLKKAWVVPSFYIIIISSMKKSEQKKYKNEENDLYYTYINRRDRTIKSTTDDRERWSIHLV